MIHRNDGEPGNFKEWKAVGALLLFIGGLLMRLVLQTANVVSDAKNCLYPNRVEAGNAAELQEAIKKDHVCGEYNVNSAKKLH